MNNELRVEVEAALKRPLVEPLETYLQVETCHALREAEKTLTNAKGRLFDPSLSSEDKRKIALAHAVKEEQFEADTWRDLVAIMAQQVNMGRPLV